MSSKDPSDITPANSGFFRDLSLRVKLILRLMADRRVSPLLKLLPVGAVAYILWPIDIPGPFDDAAIAWLSTYMFVELCPPSVVQEHLDKLKQASPIDWSGSPADTDVVDAEFRETVENRSKTEETPR